MPCIMNFIRSCKTLNLSGMPKPTPLLQLLRSGKIIFRTTQFQKKGCDHYKLLGIIFNNKKENEAFHYSSNEENELDNQYLNIVRGSRVHNDMQEVECVTCSVKRKIPLKDQNSTKVCMSRDEATSFVSSDCSITKCVAALEEIEDISNDIYLKALKEFKDPDWREMFIAMSNDRRRG